MDQWKGLPQTPPRHILVRCPTLGSLAISRFSAKTLSTKRQLPSLPPTLPNNTHSFLHRKCLCINNTYDLFKDKQNWVHINGAKYGKINPKIFWKAEYLSIYILVYSFCWLGKYINSQCLCLSVDRILRVFCDSDTHNIQGHTFHDIQGVSDNFAIIKSDQN